jgi:membrane protein YdbS with pleckstrin-like domain
MTTELSAREGDILAVFDPKVKVYLWLQIAIACGVTMVGLVLLPPWLILGPFWANLYFQSIEARLTERSVVYRHGIWFRKEMSIPLDKIQDVSLHTGPILNAFGLATLQIDTAGVKDAEGFRAAVINRRDALHGGPRTAESEDLVLMREIRDSLRRIEGHLAQRG